MIDLHCHSVFSDGTNTPEELVSLAQTAGLSALALTDHDTTDGLPRFFKAGENSSVQTLAGIELSTEYGDSTLHILGYGFDPDNSALQEGLTWVRAGRTERNALILEKLNQIGFDITYEDVRRQSADDLIGRPHFAAALIEKGHFNHKDKVFKQLLGKNRPAYVDRRRLTPEQCVELIRNAGGISVIAHPGQLKLTSRKLRRMVGKLHEQGLGGVEVWYSSHQPHQTRAFERICEDFDLIATGGSDFHGAVTPQLSLGIGFGGLEVADSVVLELTKRLKK